MAIRASFDAASRVTTELSEFMEELVNDPDREEPPTLDTVREALRRGPTGDQWRAGLLHPQDQDSLVVELERLIEEFGGEALAIEFIASHASEPLSRLIEAVMAQGIPGRRATLGSVREAMISGLAASMSGDGAIETDEDTGVLLSEIDELIERYGEHTLAEPFVRFE